MLALPIILKSSDLTSPTPIVVFTPQYLDIDDKSPGPKSWEFDNAYPSQFRLIHEARVLPKANGDLDMVLVAGKEGIVLIWYDVDENSYKYNIVGTGIPDPRDDKVKYWGSGSIEVCRVGDDEVGYLATCEVRIVTLSLSPLRYRRSSLSPLGIPWEHSCRVYQVRGRAKGIRISQERGVLDAACHR